MIDGYIKELCGLLHIQEPSVSYNTSHFNSFTMMAQCDTSGTTIFLRKMKENNPDLLFAVAHELRHIWQIKTDENLYFADYNTVDKIGVYDYNMQLAELDANAFGMIVMREFFHLQAQFDGMSPPVKDEIYKRASVIEKTIH